MGLQGGPRGLKKMNHPISLESLHHWVFTCYFHWSCATVDGGDLTDITNNTWSCPSVWHDSKCTCFYYCAQWAKPEGHTDRSVVHNSAELIDFHGKTITWCRYLHILRFLHGRTRFSEVQGLAEKPDIFKLALVQAMVVWEERAHWHSTAQYAISVDMKQWTAEHRAFVVETFFKTGVTVTLTHWRFHVHFNVGHYSKVPSRNTIFLWIANFRSTGSALKTKLPVGARTVRTPENVRWAVVTSPCHSAMKQSVRQILHLD
jgi:hypothetical protein